MQTFVPCPLFHETARVLDKRRLFKQVIEARQILAGLGEKIPKIDGTWYKPSHKNHPIYKMWNGYNECLALYHNELMDECLRRKINTVPFYFDLNGKCFTSPSWLGNRDFHSRHRAALLAKNLEWYGQFGWTEEPKIDYLWE